MSDVPRHLDDLECDKADEAALKGKDVAFNSSPVTRNVRAERARVYFNTYDAKQQAFLDFVLHQYVNSGVDELDDDKLRKLLELKYHAMSDAIHELGNAASIRKAFIGFQLHLYEHVAS